MYELYSTGHRGASAISARDVCRLEDAARGGVFRRTPTDGLTTKRRYTLRLVSREDSVLKDAEPSVAELAGPLHWLTVADGEEAHARVGDPPRVGGRADTEGHLLTADPAGHRIIPEHA